MNSSTLINTVNTWLDSFNNWVKKARGESKPSKMPDNLEDETLRFKVIIDSIDEGVVLIDSQGTIKLTNPYAASMCGWKAEEADGINVNNVVKLVNNKGEIISD